MPLMKSQDQPYWNSQKTNILSQLCTEEFVYLKQHTETVTKKKGEILWSSKPKTPEVILVDEGYVRICALTPEGRRFIMGVLGPGEFYGAINPEFSTMNDGEILEIVRDAKLYRIQSDVFQQIIATHPTFAMRLAYILENQKRTLQHQLMSILFKDVTSRVASLLVDFCERYSMPCPYQDGHSTDIPLTHQEIADMIGAARQVVSGIISKLIKADIIHKHDRLLCVVNKEALLDVAENGARALDKL